MTAGTRSRCRPTARSSLPIRLHSTTKRCPPTPSSSRSWTASTQPPHPHARAHRRQRAARHRRHDDGRRRVSHRRHRGRHRRRHRSRRRHADRSRCRRPPRCRSRRTRGRSPSPDRSTTKPNRATPSAPHHGSRRVGGTADADVIVNDVNEPPNDAITLTVDEGASGQILIFGVHVDPETTPVTVFSIDSGRTARRSSPIPTASSSTTTAAKRRRHGSSTPWPTATAIRGRGSQRSR